ncbi:MAG: type II secretion system protein GspJ [Bacillota bacterium]|nr:type II secretion system protein GspJ [Bacillota bacterium]
MRGVRSGSPRGKGARPDEVGLTAAGRNWAPPGEAGFTLLELLVALTLFSLALLAVERALGPALAGWRSFNARLEEEGRLQVAVQWLERDLRSAFPAYPWVIEAARGRAATGSGFAGGLGGWAGGAGSGLSGSSSGPGVLLRGGPEGLALVRRGGRSGLLRVEYHFDPQRRTLLRRQWEPEFLGAGREWVVWPMAGGGEGKGGAEASAWQEVLSGVEAAGFRYYDRRHRQWLEYWEGRDLPLPAAVAVEVVLESPKRVFEGSGASPGKPAMTAGMSPVPPDFRHRTFSLLVDLPAGGPAGEGEE